MKPLLLFFTLSLFSLKVSAQQEKVRVAIAANLLYPLKEIEKSFEENFSIDLELISASSGVLYNQIINGAPYDVYLSANKKYPTRLVENGFCATSSEFTYGQVVFWSATPVQEETIIGYILKLSPRTLAIANPDLAPFGTETVKWINSHVSVPIDDKLVLGDNVGQVNRYIYSGAVTAAFTGNSAMHSELLGNNGNWVVLSDAEPVPQAGCILNASKSLGAKTFYEYLLSDEGQSIFSNFGYISVNANSE